jgi:hypothetical protein
MDRLRRAHLEMQSLKRESLFPKYSFEELRHFRCKAQIPAVPCEHSGVQDLGTWNAALLPSEFLPPPCRWHLDLQCRTGIGRRLVFAQVGVDGSVIHRLFDDDVAIPNEQADLFPSGVIRDRGESGGDRGVICIVDPQSAELAVIRHAKPAFSRPSPAGPPNVRLYA